MYIMYELHVCVYVWTNIHLIVLIGVSLFQVTIKYNMEIIKC